MDMETAAARLVFDWPSVVTLLVGVSGHITKKVVECRKADKSFNLKRYLTMYPYQSYLTLLAAAGSYGTLALAGSLDPVSAFFAGIAANSIGDMGPGNRNEI